MHSRVILALIGLALFVATCQAAAGAGKFSDPANPGKCTILGEVLSPGEEKDIPGKCTRVTCAKEDGTGTFTSCGLVAPPPGCTLGDKDLSKPYPDCCHMEIKC